jgi:peptidyl-prolyl cis-trans isomerase C
MQLSIITNKNFRNLVVLACSLLLVNIACKKDDVATAENASPQKQAAEKIAAKKADSTKPSTVIVEVNGTKLTQNDIDTELGGRLQAMKAQLPPDQFEKERQNFQKQFVEYHINRTLLTQEADKQKIVVNEDEMKSALKEIETKLPEGMTLEAMLQQSGGSMEKMREDIGFSLRVNKLLDSQIKTDFTPSDDEIKNYYTTQKAKFGNPETVHARHILLKVDEKDSEKIKGEKKAKIEGVRNQLTKGADFEKLAKENSDCPSKEKGGDLGTFPRGRMAKPFEEAAFGQKANEIGPVVTTQFGYHVIQVLEHNKAQEKTLNEVKDSIKEILINQKKNEIATKYVAGLRDKATITYGSGDAPKK